MAEALVGKVTHYYGKPHVGVVKLSAPIAVGDVLHFCGHGADFQQALGSMEIDHAKVERAPAGSEVAIQVGERLREGAEVYRVAS